MERHTRSYLQLIKPGITLSNTMTAVAGFFLASSVVAFRLEALIGATLGIALVIASACVLNNIIDRDIDVRMKRTRRRAVVSGAISVLPASLFLIVLGVAGFSLLLFLTNIVTFILGVIAYFWYVVIYGVAKRTTPFSTIIGGVPGALPPVAGYTALTGVVDPTAIVLFFILFFWQIPHFYAISIFRRNDYANAGLPVWAVRYGVKSAKLQILVSVIMYGIVTSLLFVFGHVGIVYLIVSSLLSLYWLYKGIVLYRRIDDEKWAKTMFGISLLLILAMSLLIAIGGYLP